MNKAKDQLQTKATLQLLNLDKLIALKRAAGRVKDFEALAELQGILERQKTN